MNRRNFFSLIPGLVALPAICKNMAPTKYWEGTTVPYSEPFPYDAWQQLQESEKRLRAATGSCQYIDLYRFKNKGMGIIT